MAFYPSLIALAFIAFAIIVMSVEFTEPVMWLKKRLSIIMVKDPADARLVLGTIIGSIISLMVFSFSMVMVVLNQISGALSPRVVPGLITNKSHQIVLGIYLGTILYSLLNVLNMQDADSAERLPALGILFSMAAVMVSLLMFVYFIHSISNSIQVDYIVNRIYRNTIRKMEENGSERISELPETEKWFELQLTEPGYLKRIESKRLKSICLREDLQVYITRRIGYYFVEGYPIMKVNKDVSEELGKELLDCLVFYIEEHVEDHYLFGFKQLNEIAVKALSPGINDPGTAAKVINLMSDLFATRLRLEDFMVFRDSDEKPRIYAEEPTLNELFLNNLIPIREYGKKDAHTLFTLLLSLKNILRADCLDGKEKKVVIQFTRSVVETCDYELNNSLDKNFINEVIELINEQVGNDDRIDFLKTSRS
jgi:uncharacterized membrane protein